MLKRLTFKLLFLASLATAQLSWAQAPAISARLDVDLISTVDGKVVHLPASQARPGDVVEYRATYVNAGPSAVANVLAVVPVPVGTTLLPEGVDPSGAQATVDGKRFEAMPLKRVARSIDGKTHEEIVPLSEYRALRWNLSSLPVDKGVIVKLRVVINPVATGAASPAIKP